jgi:hypothetical protein
LEFPRPRAYKTKETGQNGMLERHQQELKRIDKVREDLKRTKMSCEYIFKAHGHVSRLPMSDKTESAKQALALAYADLLDVFDGLKVDLKISPGSSLDALDAEFVPEPLSLAGGVSDGN